MVPFELPRKVNKVWDIAHTHWIMKLLFWALKYYHFLVQSLSHVRLFATPWTSAHQVSLPFTISWSLLKFISIESMMPSKYLIFFHPFSSCLLTEYLLYPSATINTLYISFDPQTTISLYEQCLFTISVYKSGIKSKVVVNLPTTTKIEKNLNPVYLIPTFLSFPSVLFHLQQYNLKPTSKLYQFSSVT